jgi:hypothetical protein
MGRRSFLFPDVPEIPGWVRRIAVDEKWTISHKRMTTFLVIVGALVAGAINLRDDLVLSIPLLAGGTALCWAMQQTIYRAQMKLDIILEILFADNTHPTGYINTVFDDDLRVRWIGYLVPRVICILLSGLTLFEIGLLMRDRFG